jgi:hypothetical protein
MREFTDPRRRRPVADPATPAAAHRIPARVGLLGLQRSAGNRAVTALVAPNARPARRGAAPVPVQRVQTLVDGSKLSDDNTVFVSADNKLAARHQELDDGTVDLAALKGAGVGPGSSTGQGTGSFVELVRAGEFDWMGERWQWITPKFSRAPLDKPANAEAKMGVADVTEAMMARHKAKVDPLSGDEINELSNLRMSHYWLRTLIVSEDGMVDDADAPQPSNSADDTPMAGPADCESFSALAQGLLWKGDRKLSFIARIGSGLVPGTEARYNDKSPYRNVARTSTGGQPAPSGGQSLVDEAMVRMVLPWIHLPDNRKYLDNPHTQLRPGDDQVSFTIDGGVINFNLVEMEKSPATKASARTKIANLYAKLTGPGRREFDNTYGHDAVNDEPQRILDFIRAPANSGFLTDYHKTLGREDRQYFTIADDGIVTFDVSVEPGNAKNLSERGVQRSKELYWALSDEGREKFDRDHGINTFADPGLGEAYLIATQDDAPGFAAAPPSTNWWGQHWGTVVLVAGRDKVTLEGYAQSGLQDQRRQEGRLEPSELLQVRDAQFAMYAGLDGGVPTDASEGFHARHGASTLHGTHYLTFKIVTV